MEYICLRIHAYMINSRVIPQDSKYFDAIEALGSCHLLVVIRRLVY